MYASPNRFAPFHQAGMEALIEFAHAQFTAFERLSALNFNLARSAFDDSTTYAKALLVSKDTLRHKDKRTRADKVRRCDLGYRGRRGQVHQGQQQDRQGQQAH